MSNVERIEREGAAASGLPFMFEHKLGQLKLASEAPASANIVVRKSDDSMGMAELEASIKRHGIIHSLITTNIGGVEYVVAGNRRLKALRKLYGAYENKMIPCVHASEFPGDMREVAMAVNISLPPHAIDQFEVFSEQVKGGLAPEEIASRHAITLRQVTQRLALAELAPEIREAWRDGKIQADAAQAFTLAPDKAAQVKAFNSILKHQGRIYVHAVQEQFVKNRNVGKALEFVGIHIYEDEGGKVIRDAFDTNFHRVSDEKLLVKLYNRRMDVECQKLLDDGWSFAVPTSSLGNNQYAYGRLELAKVTMTKDERKVHADLTARIEANDDDDEAAEALEELENVVKFRAYTPDHKKRSGCFVDVGDRGELLIQYGRTKPADRSKAPAPAASTKGKADSKPKPPQTSQILKQRLDQQLLKATAAAIVTSQTGKGLPGLLARIVAMQITWQRPTGIPMTVSGQLSNIRNIIEPKVMYAAILEAFDAKDYFNSIPKDLIAAAVSESMSADHAAKVREMGKEAAAKFAVANVTPTGWLPRELRLASYRGPKGSVAKKAKRK